MSSIPPSPNILSPANGSAFAETTQTVLLSWSAVLGAGVYNVRVHDLTEPDLRHPGNNCVLDRHYVCVNGLTQTSLRVSVKPGHAYRWWVHKVVGSQPSVPAAASFRVGECDAAEVVRFYVPEILEPGKETVVSVTIRNVGSKTWKPELGLKLGAQNPHDNTVWGTNRAAMHASSQTGPGETHTFEWLIRAPQTPGVYNFQWRMLCEGVHWFGARTPNRCIHVKARGAGGSWLTRDTKSGLLQQPTGNIVTFRGGHYHLFEKTGAADRMLVYQSDGQPIRLDYGAGRPCAPYTDVPPSQGGDPPLPTATLSSWPGESTLWAELFALLRQHRINLLRVFLMNGFGIQPSGTREVNFEVYPFNTVEVNETDPATPRTKMLKWKIRDAITHPLEPTNWNVNYFNRLRAFAEEARKAGVYLQLSLFNYYELNNGPWDISIWNPARCFEAAWGTTNLVNPPEPGQGQRQLFFIAPSAGSGLRLVQEQMVRKVVRELCCFTNIILEVMNEPHRGTYQQSSQFSSEVVGWITDEGGECLPAAWRPLISVNASLRPFDPDDLCREISDTFDVDWWAEHSDPAQPDYVKNYEEVDIISYHGLTGYGPDCIDITCKCLSAGCKQRTYANVQFPAGDLDSISRRFCDFYGSGRMRAGACDSFGKHPNKALMMSTDAVSVGRYIHRFGAWDMNLRDGQVTTGLGNAEGTPEEKRTRSDLENWAFWCFCVARSNGGVIHFQNHSTYEDTYPAINKAFRDSLGSD